MPKMKTSSTAKRRIRVTGSGKLTHKRRARGAKLEKKSSKRKRGFGLDREVTAADTNALKKMLRMR